MRQRGVLSSHLFSLKNCSKRFRLNFLFDEFTKFIDHSWCNDRFIQPWIAFYFLTDTFHCLSLLNTIKAFVTSECREQEMKIRCPLCCIKRVISLAFITRNLYTWGARGEDNLCWLLVVDYIDVRWRDAVFSLAATTKGYNPPKTSCVDSIRFTSSKIRAANLNLYLTRTDGFRIFFPFITRRWFCERDRRLSKFRCP